MCDGESGRSPKRFSGRLRFRQHSAFPYFSRVKFTWRVLVATERSDVALVSRLSHIFMDTQLLIIAFLRIRTLDKLFEATIALVNFRICN